jgi:DNA invertase Pin-like site-specific DNA recombinase
MSSKANGRLRAVIYARFSTDLQRDASIVDQVRICRRLADQHGWHVTKFYSDAAISGANRTRPGFLEMIRDAEAGEIDVVVAESLDRLGRKLADIADVFDRLHFRSVHIHTVQQGEVSQMHVGILSTMSQMFLSDLRAKTHRGLEGLVRQGKSAGGLSYGYRAVSDAAGRGGREIEPAEAEVVRRIFRAYADGRSPKAIAHALNVEHMPGPRGGVWAATTINGNRAHGTGILNNRLYIGELVWNRRSWMKDPATGKRVPRMNAAEDVIVKQVPQLRIVDDALWQAVRARQRSLTPRGEEGAPPLHGGERQGFWAARRPRHVFSGLLKCGACGAGFAKCGARHFGCTAARTKGATVCSNRLVITAMRERLMDPDVFRVFAEEFVTEWNKAQAEAAAGIAAKQA